MARPISVGDIVCVKWPESPRDEVIVGEWDGRVVAVNGSVITVCFEYPKETEAGSIREFPRENIDIDLKRRWDNTYNVPVVVKRGSCG